MKKIIAMVMLMGASIYANAGIIVYGNSTNWESDVASFITEDFTSSPLSMTTSNFTQNFNGFSLGATTFGDWVGVTNNTSTACQNTPLCTAFSNQNYFGWRNGNGGHGPDIAFNGLGSAIGFDFFNSDPTDDYRIFVNGSLVGAFNKSNAGFFGVRATAGDTITSFQIMHHSTGGYVGLAGIDNVRTSSVNVPEPSSIAILGLGLISLIGVNRRKIKNSNVN
jgi:hypothetical protein